MITINLGERYMDHEMRQWLLVNTDALAFKLRFGGYDIGRI